MRKSNQFYSINTKAQNNLIQSIHLSSSSSSFHRFLSIESNSIINQSTITFYRMSNQSIWMKIKSPIGLDEYIPRIIDISPSSYIQEYFQQWRKKRCLFWLLLFLILFLLICIILGLIFLLIYLLRPQSSINNLSTTLSTRLSSTTTTTSVTCLYPNVINSINNRCVNLMIDSNNCGFLSNQCLINQSCSAGKCSDVPGIQLNASQSIWSSSLNGSADDQMFPLNLPWNITLYNITTNQVIVTTDGVLCFGNCSTTYTESTLPSNSFTGVTLFPYWDDLYIYSNTSQGIYYQSEGILPNRQLIIEYYTSHYLQSREFYHFQIIFNEQLPNIVQLKYYQATDQGATCTIGIQASNLGPFLLYSYDQMNSIQENLLLTFNTNLGTISKNQQ